jgi:hypothetical protein
MADEEKSELAAALEERAKNRKTQLVDGLAFTGPGDKVVGALAMRVATKQEENLAILRAEVYVRDLGKGSAIELKDPSLIEAARTVFILAEVCRHPKHPQSASVFGTGKWMMENLTCDEIGKLLDIYNRHRVAASPFDQAEMTPEVVEETAAQLGQYATTDLADAIVQNKDRIWLEQFCIRLAMMHANRNEELATYRAMSLDAG